MRILATSRPQQGLRPSQASSVSRPHSGQRAGMELATIMCCEVAG